MFHRTPSSASYPADPLAMDVPLWPMALPEASSATAVHSSRVNVFLPCMRWSRRVIRSSSHLCLLQGFGPSLGSSVDLHTTIAASHGDGPAPGLLDFLSMLSPVGLGVFLLNITLLQTPHPGAYLLLLLLPPCCPSDMLSLASSLPTPLDLHSELYPPSAERITPCESLPGQRVPVFISLP